MKCANIQSKITDDRTKYVVYQCGRCQACLSKRVSGWSFRLQKEAERSSSGYFLTLTYDPDHVPLSSNNFATLYKKDMQLYLKLLRKRPENKGRKIKYYLCGEYGSKTRRPHYHLIIFNAHIESLLPAWKKGSGYIGTLTLASVGYTLKYMSKGRFRRMHKNDDRQPEFSLMSKRLGDNYMSENMANWHHARLEDRYYIPIQDGKKIALPRYYKEKIYTQEQREQIGNTLVIREIIENEKKFYQQSADDRLQAVKIRENLLHEIETRKTNRTI